jgi:hypothetical protein
MTAKLKPEFQKLSDEFEADFAGMSCYCHLCAPCSWCVHPGNPHNLELEDAYEDDDK